MEKLDDTCRIEGCAGKVFARSLCSKHYNRWRKTGTTDDGPRARKPFYQRFWEKVDKRGENECWPWIGNSWTYGYGTIHTQGRAGRQVQSNRAAWMLTNGDIPEGMVVRHTCHNRACCNPAHLKLGTRADNVQDMWDREDGAPKGNAKLTQAQVREILDSPLSSRKIAPLYGVSDAHIRQIRRGRSWGNLQTQTMKG